MALINSLITYEETERKLSKQVTVVKEFTFDAAHYLPNHPGKCKNFHGHTYKLQVGITGEIDAETGMVADFSFVKEVVQDIVSLIDHVCLNEIKSDTFPAYQPTAERMVLWVRNVLFLRWTPVNSKVSFIRLYETPTSYAEWREDSDK